MSPPAGPKETAIVSSLLNNHLIRLSLNRQARAQKTACWELLDCAKVLCPAHGCKNEDCWLVPRTHCTNMIEEDFFQKLANCLTCSYFNFKAEQYVRGENHFVADQIQRYNVKALEQIYQKEESFVEILNRLPDGLFTTDHEWRITYFNPSAEKITGFSAYDAVGMYCKDVFKNAICESDCALKRAVEEGHDIHNREYTITNIDGDEIPIICSTSAFVDRSGRITGGLEIFKDISEIKKLQEEVARRERKYRRIFEGSHDSIYTTNKSGRILDMNPAGVDLLGYSSKKALIESICAQDLYLNPDDRKKFLAKINEVGFVKDYEVDFKTREGSPLHVLISSRRYENKETGDVEYEGIIKDITHRKKTEKLVRERNRELSILNSVAVALNNTLDLDHILSVTLVDVLKALRLNHGALFLVDPRGKKTVLQVRHGLPAPDSNETNPVFFKDYQLERHLIHHRARVTPKPTFPPFQVNYQTDTGAKSPWLTCFLITFKGRGVGFFGLDIPSHRRLNKHEIHLLGSLGNFLGGTIENTRLVRTVRQHRQDLRRLTDKLFQSQEEERRRIARELHDEAGQSLTAVKLGLDRLEENHANGNDHLRDEIDEIRQMIKRTSSEIRGLSYRLHPTLLIDLGLEPALNRYFNDIERHSGLGIDFSMVGFDQRLPVDMETVLYRFSQEALTNTLKHAKAKRFRLSIIKSYPRIIFLAEDDGIGFDTQIINKDQRSLGLLGMRERASLLGGSFYLRSLPAEGTRIRIEIPISEGAEM
jgi:PAS domain S-box-containing protein